jgi:hypothetical protein
MFTHKYNNINLYAHLGKFYRLNNKFEIIGFNMNSEKLKKRLTKLLE